MRHCITAIPLILSIFLVPASVGAQQRNAPNNQNAEIEWQQDAIDGMAAQGYSRDQIVEVFQRYGYPATRQFVSAVLDGSQMISYGLVGGDRNEMAKYLVSRGLDSVFYDTVYGGTGVAILDDLLQQFARGNSGPGSVMCSSVAMDAFMAAGSAVAGIFTGGRATVVAQLAQQIQLLQANRCAGVSNDHLAASNENEALMIDYLIQMLKGTNWNNQNAATNGIQAMASVMMGGGQNYSVTGVQEDYAKSYPETYAASVDNEAMVQESQKMLSRQRQSQIAAQRQQAFSATALNSRSKRVAEIMASGRAAPGPTAVAQEQLKMDALVVESVSAMHADIIAAERTKMNELARQQQERAMEERMFDNAMKGWGECSRCTSRSRVQTSEGN